MKVIELYGPREKVTLNSYLEKKGVADVPAYLKPTGDYFENYQVYTDMYKAVDVLEELASHATRENKLKVAIIQDGDADGVFSTYILFDYLSSFSNVIKPIIFIHQGKERGLQDPKALEAIEDFHPSLVIVPDAGTNDKKQAKILIKKGINVIILDHHDYETPVEDGVLINNQNDTYECNKNGSGTLVTHKFLEALDDRFQLDLSQKYFDIVGMSLISDAMDITEMENREYLYHGVMNYGCIRNQFLKALIDKFVRKEEYSQKDLSWSVIPKINAICRSSDIDLKRRLMMALCDRDDQEEVLELCKEAHKKQIDTVSGIVEEEFPNVSADNNMVFLASENMPRSYSGLIAGKLSEMCGKKPAIVGAVKNGYLIGSVRSPIPIKHEFLECESIDFAKGHGAAFGIGIKEENIPALLKWMETVPLDIEVAEEVLKSYNIQDIPDNLFEMFEGYDYIWSNGNLPKPLFHVKGIKINTDDIIIMGKNKRTLKIKYDGIDIMRFNALKEDKEALGLGYYKGSTFVEENAQKNIELEVIGYLAINEWNGVKYKQIIIEKYEVSETKKLTGMDFL